MPRRKIVRNTNLTEDPQTEEYHSESVEPSAKLGLAVTPVDLHELPFSNLVSQKRELFENAAADELELVRKRLHEILNDPETSAKDAISASKLILQVNGLLDRKQVVDAESIGNLVRLLTRKSEVTITDITPE